jgi:hypothetical protein
MDNKSRMVTDEEDYDFMSIKIDMKKMLRKLNYLLLMSLQ